MRMKGLLVGVLSAAMSVSAWAQQRRNDVVTPDQLQKITAAMPEKPAAQPTKARKILVFNLCGPRGFVHDSIPHGTKAMEIMGQKTGAWTTTVSNDPAVFEPESLNQYDAVVMVNTTADLFAAPQNATDEQKQAYKAREARIRQSLLDFVNSGKGLAGIHAATDCFYNWPEFGKMIGGYFDGHPWQAADTVTLKIDDPKHPVNACFHEPNYTITDEIYQFKDPYTRDALHILTSLDTTKTNMTKRGIKRTDGDFAVSWVREYGKGRVFYCSIGHRQDIYWNPVILKHYLAGIQYALGDLKCDATPSSKKVTMGGDEIGWVVLAADSGKTRALFNGQDLTGWTAKPNGWTVKDGVLTWAKGAGDIWTTEQFGDFILDLEFNVAKGTNSGVFIRTGNPRDNVQTGIEIQVFDSNGQKPSKHSCGAFYDALAPSKTTVKPAGEWNRMLITTQGPKLQVSINGEQVINADLDQWKEAGKNPDGSKNKYKKALKDFPRKGLIGFQDHGGSVLYRNIKITTLE